MVPGWYGARDVFSADGGAFLGPRSSVEDGGEPVAQALPSFARLLAVSPAFLARHAQTATEATLLLDVASAAADLDLLLDHLADQLLDRARIQDILVPHERAVSAVVSADPAAADTTLVALHYQAQAVNEQNVGRLLDRIDKRKKALLDLRYLIAQDVEKQRLCTDSGKGSNGGSSSEESVREALLRVELVLLERLNTLATENRFPTTFNPLAPSNASENGASQSRGRAVCWPAFSNSDESKHSVLDDTRLSGTFGSLPLSSTTLSGQSTNDRTLTEGAVEEMVESGSNAADQS